jgi:hypothetical protein
MQSKFRPKKVRPKLGKISGGGKNKTKTYSNILTLDKMFYQSLKQGTQRLEKHE